MPTQYALEDFREFGTLIQIFFLGVPFLNDFFVLLKNNGIKNMGIYFKLATSRSVKNKSDKNRVEEQARYRTIALNRTTAVLATRKMIFQKFFRERIENPFKRLHNIFQGIPPSDADTVRFRRFS